MTKCIYRLNKPEYIVRPQQMMKRVLSSVLPKPRTVEVMLPWGLRILVRPAEDIGAAIWRLGVYYLPLSEVIWRLLDPGEVAVDCGANVGYVTSLMAARVGPKGRVLSFEPHPKIFAELAANTHRLAELRNRRDTAFASRGICSEWYCIHGRAGVFRE